MLTIRHARERGHANHGWLDSYHSFSFASYYDPDHMGFRDLRVINDDRIAAGGGFPDHPHRDMEILTYVVEGAIQHRDSMGNGTVIRPGDVQRMTAGTGVTHSEFNPGQEELRLLQIWIRPVRAGLTPGYEQKAFPLAERQGQLRLVASPDGRDGSLLIHQDAYLYTTHLAAGNETTYALASDRHAWLQVIDGSLTVNGTQVSSGDGLAVSEEIHLRLRADSDAHLLLFDLS